MLESSPTTMSEEGDRSALGQLTDPNIQIVPGKAYHSYAGKHNLGISKKGKTPLSIEDIKQIRANHKKSKLEGNVTTELYLNELLMGAEVVIPTLEIPERDPELEKKLAKVRRKLEEKEYQRMTRNVNSSYNAQLQSQPEDSIGYQIKQMNSVIITVIQFIISIAAAFLFGFQGVEIFVGPLELAVRLLLGIAAAVIVGVAELYIMVVHLDAREERENANAKKVQ